MIVINGVQANALDPRDRGFAYGDGVFRTVALRDGLLEAWPQQWAKLAKDCQALSLQCPDPSDWLEAIRLAVGEMRDAALKLMVTRGCGLRGYLYPQPQQCNWLVLTGPLPVYDSALLQQGITARWCDLRLSSQPLLAGVKHLNRLENVLARNEWQEPQVREGLLLDQQGHVIEGTMSNLLLLTGQVLLTPALEQCGVAGVTRERILLSAARLGWRVEIGDVSVEQVLAADEVGVCNSLIGLWPVRALPQRQWQQFAGLQSIWQDALQNCQRIALQ